MDLAYCADDVRAAEAPLLAAGVPLMDRAAYALAVHSIAALRRARVPVRGARAVVLVGAGNNGGDGLHAAALLARRGLAVEAVLAGAHAHPGGLTAARAAGVTITDLPQVDEGRLHRADLVLDALVGIGGDGSEVRGAAGQLIARLDALTGSGPLVVAVDVPSGAGVDDGALRGPVLRADLTVTFGATKPGLLLPPGDAAAGRVEVVDIGLDLSAARPAVERLTGADVGALWPVPGARTHKYTRGVLGLVAGSARYPGAAVLAASGAVRAGVGMVRFVPDEPTGNGALATAVLAARPEVVVGSGRVQAWVAGSGLAPQDEARRGDVAAVLAASRQGVPAVLDAGALASIDGPLGPHVVLTPHAGELALLLTALGRPATRAQVEDAPLAHARTAHELTGATVLLKGATTLVVGPGVVLSQADGTGWLATAGSGDVLAGLLGALLAGCAEHIALDRTLPARLAAAAALVHGRAAHTARPGGPVSASDLAQALPETIAQVLAEASGSGRGPAARGRVAR
ncbi:MAG: bifunctional ADP-dependent NAD(P)H-hydrate dehydratase/NAD(P)H-hydrate epimerase [Actinobacteria bacterium]|nr:bifunctional ADP-dependent NAD(P)H-hydrate dehydratase/NAD(P)H-hydrate epimerase [Actinomycetota bacterium]MCG2800479.1 bifunctional ADP-dependent NAD(P)H-hydrate dehydratase/NAD(P)H-hydrate epimerase [Cellulomonas sp.]